MRKFFASCTTMEMFKKEYRRLIKEHHPDNGGDTATMQEVNAQYDMGFVEAQKAYNADREPERRNTETPEQFRGVMEALMRCEGLVIEICGTWVWVSGDTRTHKELLKGLGFKWASQKKMWYLGQRMTKGRRRPYTMEKIREEYGSDVHRGKDETEKLAG